MRPNTSVKSRLMRDAEAEREFDHDQPRAIAASRRRRSKPFVLPQNTSGSGWPGATAVRRSASARLSAWQKARRAVPSEARTRRHVAQSGRSPVTIDRIVRQPPGRSLRELPQAIRAVGPVMEHEARAASADRRAPARATQGRWLPSHR